MRSPWRFPCGAGHKGRFRFCEGGAAAVEFVLVFPLLISLLVAGNELARYIRARQQLNDYAGMVAYDIAGASTDVSVHTLGEMIRRFGLVAPELVDPTRDAWPTASNTTPYFSVGVTMVEMMPYNCAADAKSKYQCKFTPQVRWSFGTKRRDCGELAKRDAGSDLLKSLPEGAFQPNAIVVVDVSADYKPLFPSGFKLGGIGYEFDLSALNNFLKKTYVAESWQSIRNWRGSTTFPGLSGVSAGGWDSTLCNQTSP
jgi:hypothetical protein